MERINTTINKHISKEQIDICDFLKNHFRLDDDEYKNALNLYYDNKTKKPTKCASFLSNGLPCQNNCIGDMNVCGMHKNKIQNVAICMEIKDSQTDTNENIKCIAINKLNGFSCTFNATCGEYCKKHKIALELSASRNYTQNSNFVCVHIIDMNEMGENICCGKPSKNNMWVCGYHKKYQTYLQHEYKSSNITEYKNMVEQKIIKKNIFIEELLDKETSE